MSWQPKLRPKGYSHTIDDFAVASLSELEHRPRTGEDKRDQRVFRVKRKHVLKACDRCRVKKTKCDGKQPCNRCSVYNHPCLFRERKATQTKVYSRGFVEMLESHHSLVVKALQKVYGLCVNKEGFPGETLAEAPDGHPLTHAILDRLGLIKQAEENADEPDEDSEDLRYLRLLSTSTECSATADPSPEPATPPEPSLMTMSRPSVCNPMSTPMTARSDSSWQWDMQSVQQAPYNYADAGYQEIIAMPRSSISAPDLASNENSPHVDVTTKSAVSHGQPHNQSFAYFLDGSCNAQDHQESKSAVRMHTGIMLETHSHPISNMSNDILGDFQFQPQESPFYPGFTPGWNFPSG
ncbi:hypothetical protein N7448_007538 [Penicillium atrosanguineum]|uniref:Uncharacterized protein n=1 Tax=Penicillium atrosanguineum TaxID=1132637 RepID=A0A9W9QDL2_9EURO|nr:uncharacterized protein N7443_001438 [Penicillium atrosanguineum]KAJ5126759.1 hypothetical protein N7448_007538 [Penicillium atrosanguineum]KAJ5146963.1 hypothetical protein N7526_000315 [Penicillium atrosanguineum]KAJ5314554.1 hypothetical protein N7443_001438 [Penicillium atrosanguineum]KAJ5331725.1 hypothetical protein N7476_001508 [Penicillium atrosanguineum]